MPKYFPSPCQAVDIVPGSDVPGSSHSAEFTFSVLAMASRAKWKCALIYSGKIWFTNERAMFGRASVWTVGRWFELFASKLFWWMFPWWKYSLLLSAVTVTAGITRLEGASCWLSPQQSCAFPRAATLNDKHLESWRFAGAGCNSWTYLPCLIRPPGLALQFWLNGWHFCLLSPSCLEVGSPQLILQTSSGAMVFPCLRWLFAVRETVKC